MPFIWFPTGAAKEGRKLARQRMKERRVAVGVPTDAPLIYKDLSSSMFDMLCLGKPPFRTSRTYTTLVLRKAMTMWGQPTVLGRRLCEQTHGDPRWARWWEVEAEQAAKRGKASVGDVRHALRNSQRLFGAAIDRLDAGKRRWGPNEPCRDAFGTMGNAAEAFGAAVTESRFLDIHERQAVDALRNETRAAGRAASKTFRVRCLKDEPEPRRIGDARRRGEEGPEFF